MICKDNLNPACAVFFELGAERTKLARIQSLAHFAHEVEVVVQVVHGGQHGAEHFAAAVEVVQVRTTKAAAGAAVGACVTRAGVAGARAVERAVVCLVTGIA